MKAVVIIGGGAAGFFAALTVAEKHKDCAVTILERSASLLSKVKISGGGRCNVTHACYDVRQLVKFYPRGEKELLGPFTKFNPVNTISWFEKRGVDLKTEKDGRMFPATDSSQTIIDCFLSEVKKSGVQICTHKGVDDIVPPSKNSARWKVITNDKSEYMADSVIIATGSSHLVWGILQRLGHTIVPPVASLFTFNINDYRIKGLEGLSVENATINALNVQQADKRPQDKHLTANGPLLITHWGMSGPAVLRLSAWGARVLAACKYQFVLQVNWTGVEQNIIKEHLQAFRKSNGKKNVVANPLFNIPRRLWERLAEAALLTQQWRTINYADLSNKQTEQLIAILTACKFEVNGKSTFKDEFVTAGGIDSSEVDFKTMQSKKHQGLFFAGEVLNIDGITGGFNFQAAWTTGFIAGSSVI